MRLKELLEDPAVVRRRLDERLKSSKDAIADCQPARGQGGAQELARGGRVVLVVRQLQSPRDHRDGLRVGLEIEQDGGQPHVRGASKLAVAVRRMSYGLEHEGISGEVPGSREVGAGRHGGEHRKAERDVRGARRSRRDLD
jgi:hypothetical protein